MVMALGSCVSDPEHIMSSKDLGIFSLFILRYPYKWNLPSGPSIPILSPHSLDVLLKIDL